jgi:hypothetical protein
MTSFVSGPAHAVLAFESILATIMPRLNVDMEMI